MAVSTVMCSEITLGEFTAIGSVASVPLHWSKLTLSSTSPDPLVDFSRSLVFSTDFLVGISPSTCDNNDPIADSSRSACISDGPLVSSYLSLCVRGEFLDGFSLSSCVSTDSLGGPMFDNSDPVANSSCSTYVETPAVVPLVLCWYISRETDRKFQSSFACSTDVDGKVQRSPLPAVGVDGGAQAGAAYEFRVHCWD